jgi:hypothetical protein
VRRSLTPSHGCGSRSRARASPPRPEAGARQGTRGPRRLSAKPPRQDPRALRYGPAYGAAEPSRPGPLLRAVPVPVSAVWSTVSSYPCEHGSPPAAGLFVGRAGGPGSLRHEPILADGCEASAHADLSGGCRVAGTGRVRRTRSTWRRAHRNPPRPAAATRPETVALRLRLRSVRFGSSVSSSCPGKPAQTPCDPVSSPWRAGDPRP